MTVRLYDDHACHLGEGPLWHPLRAQLFWFDIIGKRLHCDDGNSWQFDRHVSAAGWIDQHHLLIASEAELFKFNLDTSDYTEICALEEDDPDTRSNDGRADPWGGFWIGTMRKDNPVNGGALYRYYKGELQELYAPLSIPNGLAFAPDKSCAYWADTRAAKVFRVALDADGWPNAAPELFLNLAEQGLNPDGSIVTADGSYLNAQWGAGRIARYNPDGEFIEAFDFPTDHITCPAIGGADLTTLFATSARQGLAPNRLAQQKDAGKTFAMPTDIKSLPEYQVQL